MLRLFQAQNYLRDHEDAMALMKAILQPVDMAVMHSEAGASVYSTQGSRFEAQIHPETEAILPHLNGKNSLETAIRGRVKNENEKIVSQILEDIREMIKLGMLIVS